MTLFNKCAKSIPIFSLMCFLCLGVNPAQVFAETLVGPTISFDGFNMADTPQTVADKLTADSKTYTISCAEINAVFDGQTQFTPMCSKELITNPALKITQEKVYAGDLKKILPPYYLYLGAAAQPFMQQLAETVTAIEKDQNQDSLYKLSELKTALDLVYVKLTSTDSSKGVVFIDMIFWKHGGAVKPLYFKVFGDKALDAIALQYTDKIGSPNEHEQKSPGVRNQYKVWESDELIAVLLKDRANGQYLYLFNKNEVTSWVNAFSASYKKIGQ